MINDSSYGVAEPDGLFCGVAQITLRLAMCGYSGWAVCCAVQA